MTRRTTIAICLACLPCAAQPAVDLFLTAGGADDRAASAALDKIGSEWKNSYAAMLVDVARLLPQLPANYASIDSPPLSPGQKSLLRIVRFLESRAGQPLGADLSRWRQWTWKLPYDPHPQYGEFKGKLYANIDSRMALFFPSGVRSLIRLDEIDWGGVKVNGIPPLISPRTVAAGEAAYLKDSDTVFGFAIAGEARAYPKRILGWHELARDRVGGVDLTIVYCTLCGTVIPYEGRHTLGTSGLLYQSNKLMFDEETGSLWSTLEGKPVVGPLAGTGVELTLHPAVTTNWGEWKRTHPATRVLAIPEEFKRDYSEGAAYRDYFATDELMFQVSRRDGRLKNKDEVLVLRLAKPLAISAKFLNRNPVYSRDGVTVLTTANGANRAYRTGDAGLKLLIGGDRVQDGQQHVFRITEEALIEEGGTRRLPRIPAHRAFWFAWYAQFPDTALVR